MTHKRRGLLLAMITLIVVCSASMVAMRPGLMRNLFGTKAENAPQLDPTVSKHEPQASAQKPVHQPGGTMPLPVDQAQPHGADARQKAKGMTLEEMTAHLKRNMDRAVAQAAADGGPGTDAAVSAEQIAASPEEATPERPWPPRHLPAQRVDKSLMTPTPLPRKPRKDEHPQPPGNSVQILPGNPG